MATQMEATIMEISPAELTQLIERGETVDLFDVRTPSEYTEVHASLAQSLPLDVIDADKVHARRQSPSYQPVYVICKSGSRGKKAAEKLRASGCEVFNVTGGTTAWLQLGLPVVRGRQTLSLERQVRIAAGFLAFLGAVLAAIFPLPYSYLGMALSGFVGLGLVNAGITDSCPMATILGKMPWNRRTC